MELTIFDDRKELEAKAVVKFLCEYISNGGTLVDWCKEKELFIFECYGAFKNAS